jgi:hypothetical protein
MAALDRAPTAGYPERAVGRSAVVASAAEELENGVPPEDLSTGELIRELDQLHRTRHATFRHGSLGALHEHNARTAELEAEYLARFPDRDRGRVQPELRLA